MVASDTQDAPKQLQLQSGGQEEASPSLALVEAFKTGVSLSDVCRLLRPLTGAQLRAVLARFNAEAIRVPLAALGNTIDASSAGGIGISSSSSNISSSSGGQQEPDLAALAGRLQAVTALVQRYSCPAVDAFAMSALRYLLGRLEQLICVLSGPSAGAKLLSKLRRGCCDAVALVGRWLSDEVSRLGCCS